MTFGFCMHNSWNVTPVVSSFFLSVENLVSKMRKTKKSEITRISSFNV